MGKDGPAPYNYATCNPKKGCPNNSAAQGEQLYKLFTTGSNSPAAYSLTGTTQCNGAEGVAQGFNPNGQGTTKGQTTIENHMTSNCQSGN